MTSLFKAATIVLVTLSLLSPAAHATGAPNRWEKLTVPLFEHLTLEHGLPHPVTVSMEQDAAGFMWFGTQRGLARWDGYQMRNFRADPNDPHSLPADFIYALHVDRQDRLWIGMASAGVAMFDKTTERFVRYPAGPKGLSEATALTIASDARGGVWVGTLGGLNYIDPVKGTVTRHLREGPGNNMIRALLVDRRGDLWIGSQGGLAWRSAAGGPVVPVPASDGSADDAVLSIGQNERGQIVFGTLKSGIGVVDLETRSTHRMKLDNVVDPANVRGLAHIAPGRWWGASYGGGIIEFDPDSGRNLRIAHRPAVASSLGHDRVTTLLRDRSGLVWVAHERGIDFYNPYNRSFETVFDGEGLPEIAVTAFLRDAHNRIWVGMADQGIDIIDADGTRNKALRPDPQQIDSALPSQLILSMHEAEPGEAWIGTPLGLYRTSDLGKKVKRIPLPLPNPYPRIGSITVRDKELWLGTVSGLVRFDPQAHTAKVYAQGDAKAGGISHNVVLTTLPAPDGRLWVGTWNGLNRLDPASGKVDYFKFAPNEADGLSDPVVSALTYDRKGRLWVGTHGGGVDIMEERNGRLAVQARLGAAQGLPVPIVAGLSTEKDDRIWVATTNGLALVDTRTLQVRPLGRADGLVLQSYFVNTVIDSGDNELIMGSSGGYTVVRRERPGHWAFRPAVVISSIRLDGKALAGAQQLAAGSRELVVPAGVKSIEVEAAALDFSAAKRNRYGFWLEGYDKAWVDGDASRRVITYGNLAPGDYRLRIRGSNREGVWSGNEVTLNVKVLPAWYQTGWAYLAYVLAALGLGWSIYTLRLRQLQRNQARLQALVELRTQEIELERANAVAATRAKSDFLANISHEIRTPMNAILGFAGLGTHLELPPQPLDYFRKIERAGQNLLGIINDVLDFSKIEAGKLELEAVPFDLHDTLNQIADMFAWRAAEKGLELVVWAEPGVPGKLVGDPLRLSQVLINLVGNAIKFTSAGSVQLHVTLDQQSDAGTAGNHTRLRFIVEDSGVGLSQEQIARLFQAFVQADTSTTRVYGGTGLGLAISQQLVAKMGGAIEVNSTLAEGSRFSFAVDLLQQAQPDSAQWELPAAARGKAILVVDDSPPTREVLLLQLRSAGFDASAVGSGAAALMALQMRPHDLVLMDWNMPEMDGIEATRQIKNHPGLSVIPTVIMVTAFDRDHIKSAASQAGVDAFLIKPVNALQLLNGVLTALGFETHLPTTSPPAAPSTTTRNIAGARVLVVDDNAINQQVAGDILRRANVAVDFASSGADAVRMVGLASYDAVLMDIQMPDMDGYQATAIIREQGQYNALPIIAMTAHAMAGYREHCIARGINDYVSKPIEPDVLYEVLFKWTRRSQPVEAVAAIPVYQGEPAAAIGTAIDRAAALSRLGGNAQLLGHLLTIFTEDFADFGANITQAIETGEIDHATLMVHKVRGAAGNLSANTLYRSAGELEKLLAAGRMDALDPALRAFTADLVAVLAAANADAADSVPEGMQN